MDSGYSHIYVKDTNHIYIWKWTCKIARRCLTNGDKKRIKLPNFYLFALFQIKPRIRNRRSPVLLVPGLQRFPRMINFYIYLRSSLKSSRLWIILNICILYSSVLSVSICWSLHHTSMTFIPFYNILGLKWQFTNYRNWWE